MPEYMAVCCCQCGTFQVETAFQQLATLATVSLQTPSSRLSSALIFNGDAGAAGEESRHVQLHPLWAEAISEEGEIWDHFAKPVQLAQRRVEEVLTSTAVLQVYATNPRASEVRPVVQSLNAGRGEAAKLQQESGGPRQRCALVERPAVPARTDWGQYLDADPPEQKARG